MEISTPGFQFGLQIEIEIEIEIQRGRKKEKELCCQDGSIEHAHNLTQGETRVIRKVSLGEGHSCDSYDDTQLVPHFPAGLHWSLRGAWTLSLGRCIAR